MKLEKGEVCGEDLTDEVLTYCRQCAITECIREINHYEDALHKLKE